MTAAEEIDLLRRELADLRDRVRQLEARPFVGQGPYQPYIGSPLMPPSPHQTWPPYWPPITACVGGTAVDAVPRNEAMAGVSVDPEQLPWTLTMPHPQGSLS